MACQHKYMRLTGPDQFTGMTVNDAFENACSAAKSIKRCSEDMVTTLQMWGNARRSCTCLVLVLRACKAWRTVLEEKNSKDVCFTGSGSEVVILQTSSTAGLSASRYAATATMTPSLSTGMFEYVLAYLRTRTTMLAPVCSWCRFHGPSVTYRNEQQ